MSFASPYLLLTLLVVPAVVAFALFFERRRTRYPVTFTNLDVLASVAEETRSLRRYVPLALVALALAFASAAVARPSANHSVPDQHATVVLLVDVSGSMRSNDVRPTRLEAAVAAMQIFLDRIPSQIQVGLVEFSTNVEILSDPTTDRDSLRTGLSYLEPQAATSLGDGLSAAVTMASSSLKQSGYVRTPGQDVPAAVVLLSDGKQTHGTLSPLQAADQAKAAGIRVYPVSLGTPNGRVTVGFGEINSIPVPPDPQTMHQIAQVTGGKAYTAQSADEVVSIYRSLGSSLGRQPERHEIGSWFAGASALFLLGAFGFGRLTEGRLP